MALPWDPGSYELVRFLFQRGLGFIYLLAFLVAARQGPGLIGEDGILPAGRFLEQVSFRQRPSFFHYTFSDRTLKTVAWGGVGLSLLAVTGLSGMLGTAFAMVVWFLLWAFYLSIVNVGQVFWGYGWESMLLETGFLAIFLGAPGVAAPAAIIWLLRWVLFRNMFGAGLIKIRGDDCWRDLTCMDYHYETQPMPNPFSWFAHHLPRWFHKLEVAGNHVMELAVPFLYFMPQPFAAVGGVATMAFQAWLMVTGNFSWLNLLTIVLAVPLFDDAMLSFLPLDPVGGAAPPWFAAAVGGVTLLVLALSVRPTLNMLSSRQIMNTSFDPLHLVNTYGAFGSITRTRHQLVVEGTQAEDPAEGDWEPYLFKGQPVQPGERPPQWAPYHLRLDWQLWFAAMTSRPRRPWFQRFAQKLLEADPDVLALVEADPFDGEEPEYVRVNRYRYRFTTRQERKETGDWWEREPAGTYLPPTQLEDGALNQKQPSGLLL